MNEGRARQAGALAKWADEVDAEDLIESSADAHDSSLARLGGGEASTAPEVPASTNGAI